MADALLCVQNELVSVPHAAHLVGRWRIVQVTSRHRASLCVKRFCSAALRVVDAGGRARLTVTLQVVVVVVVVIWSLDEMPQLGAGIRRPGVRKERRDVEAMVVLGCRSGAFL